MCFIDYWKFYQKLKENGYYQAIHHKQLQNSEKTIKCFVKIFNKDYYVIQIDLKLSV